MVASNEVLALRVLGPKRLEVDESAVREFKGLERRFTAEADNDFIGDIDTELSFSKKDGDMFFDGLEVRSTNGKMTLGTFDIYADVANTFMSGKEELIMEDIEGARELLEGGLEESAEEDEDAEISELTHLQRDDGVLFCNVEGVVVGGPRPGIDCEIAVSDATPEDGDMGIIRRNLLDDGVIEKETEEVFTTRTELGAKSVLRTGIEEVDIVTFSEAVREVDNIGGIVLETETESMSDKIKNLRG